MILEPRMVFIEHVSTFNIHKNILDYFADMKVGTLKKISEKCKLKGIFIINIAAFERV